jgi:hypothetical protein
MQTNLHRVSEFAVTSGRKADAGEVKADTRVAIKRFRERDSDTESEVDDTFGSSTISTTLPDLGSQGGSAPEPQEDSSKSDAFELDTTAFLSLDWENEEPYEKAVERYYLLTLFFVHPPPLPSLPLSYLSCSCLAFSLCGCCMRTFLFVAIGTIKELINKTEQFS